VSIHFLRLAPRLAAILLAALLFARRSSGCMPMSPGTAASLAALLLAALLSGCMPMSPGAAARLAALDPLEANPAEIRLAIEAPRLIALRDGDLVMSVTHPGGNGMPPLEERFAAEIEDEVDTVQGVPAAFDADRRIIVARFAPEDHARLIAAQKKARAMQNAGARGKGAISVGATGCRTGEPDGRPIRFSILMQTRTGTAFFPLHEDLDLNVLLKGTGGVMAMPLCSPPVSAKFS
jgi:hypothetical protein